MDTTSTTYKKDRLSHAIHNERAARHLYNNGNCEFADWTITTSFYSALNYAKHKIFPIADIREGKMVFCYTFEQYLVENDLEHSEKHGVVKNLIKKHCPAIRENYEQLMDMCWGARYVEYKRDPNEALHAIELLSLIRAICHTEMTKIEAKS